MLSGYHTKVDCYSCIAWVLQELTEIWSYLWFICCHAWC